MKKTANDYDLLLVSKETRTIYGLNMTPGHDSGFVDANDIATDFAEAEDCQSTCVDYWDGDMVRNAYPSAYVVPQEKIDNLKNWLDTEWMLAEDDQTDAYVRWHDAEADQDSLRQEIAESRWYDLDELSRNEVIDEKSLDIYETTYATGMSRFAPGKTVDYMRIVLDGQEYYAEGDHYESLLSNIQTQAKEDGRTDAHWIF